MDARKLMLSALAGGMLLGLVLGAAADPTMVPPPEPTWRKLQPDPVHGGGERFVDLGPQDLSPAWSVDRMPTWKRRELERSMRAVYEPPLEPAFATEPYMPMDAPANVAEGEDAPALAEAAEPQAPVRDARAPAAEAPAPAIVDDADDEPEITLAPQAEAAGT